MRASRPEVILFDLGGVLLENSGRERLAEMMTEREGAEDLRLRWLSCAAVQQFERGRISAREFSETLVTEWRLNLPPERFIEAFATWPRGFFPGAADLVASLRARYKVGCLSNSNEVHWARFPELATLFDVALSSHEIGHVKPDREAFDHALTVFDVAPENVVFFDDLGPNIEAARAVGMRAFQVEGLEAVKSVLRSESLY